MLQKATRNFFGLRNRLLVSLSTPQRNHADSHYDSQSGRWIKIPDGQIIRFHDTSCVGNVQDFLALAYMGHATIEIENSLENNLSELLRLKNNIKFPACKTSAQITNYSDLDRAAMKSNLIEMCVFTQKVTETSTSSKKMSIDMLEKAGHIGLNTRVDILTDITNDCDIYRIVDHVAEFADVGAELILLRNPTEGVIDDDVLRQILEECLNLDVLGSPMKARMGFCGNMSSSSTAIEAGIINLGTVSSPTSAVFGENGIISMQSIYDVLIATGKSTHGLDPNPSNALKQALSSTNAGQLS